MRTKESELFTELILNIFRLNGLLISEGDRLTEKLGLTSARWKVLGAIALSGKPLTVAQISRSMGQTRQSVQRIADRMSEAKILKYMDNPDHKRAKLLKLTKKGADIYNSLDKIQAPWANNLTRDIKADEFNSALATIRKLIEKIES